MKYTDELIDSVNKFNKNIEEIAQKILNLKLELNEEDIDAKKLFDMKYKLSVINNVKSRRVTEKLLENVIIEYGYILETFRDTGKLP